MNLNKAELIGNLVADPILKTLPSGQSVASFRIATSYRWLDVKTKKRQENTEFHPMVAWGRLGDVVGKYLKKGDKVYVDGRLQTKTWEGKDGVKRNQTEIVAQNLIMLGGAKKKGAAEKVNNEVVVEEIDIKNVPVTETK